MSPKDRALLLRAWLGVVAGLVVVGAVIATPGPAEASTTPQPSPTATATATAPVPADSPTVATAPVTGPSMSTVPDSQARFDDLVTVKDSHGLGISDYRLSGGGPVTEAPARMALRSVWDFYRGMVAYAIWLLGAAVKMSWLDLLAPPLEGLSYALRSTVARLGVASVLGALAVLLSWRAWSSGRTITGLLQGMTAALFIALAASPWSTPVATMAGSDGSPGLISQARQVGMEISAQIAVAEKPASSDAGTRRPLNAEAQLDALTGRLIEVMIRTPHQLVNYGADIDRTNPGCVAAYDDALRSGTTTTPVANVLSSSPVLAAGAGSAIINAGTTTAREKVAACDAAYGAAADDPQSGLSMMFLVYPAGVLLVLLMYALAGALLGVSILALGLSAYLIVQVTLGIIDGDQRRRAWDLLMMIGMCLVTIVVLLVGLGLFLTMVDAIFSVPDTTALQSLAFLNTLLVVAIVVTITQLVLVRRRGKKAGGRVHAAASRTSPTSMGSGRTPAALLAGAAATHVMRGTTRRQSGRGVQSGRPEQGAPTVVDKMATAGKFAGKAAVLAGKVAIGSTVGLPVAAPRAVQALTTAASAARSGLSHKLAATTAKATTTATAKAAAAKAYTQEYVHNLGVAGRAVTRPVALAREHMLGPEMRSDPTVASPGTRIVVDAPATHTPTDLPPRAVAVVEPRTTSTPTVAPAVRPVDLPTTADLPRPRPRTPPVVPAPTPARSPRERLLERLQHAQGSDLRPGRI